MNRNPKKENRFGRHAILSVVLAVIVIAIAAACGSGGSTSNPTSASSPHRPKPSPTGTHQQAVASARKDLSAGLGVSRSGLIGQLTSKYGGGFPESVAVLAVDHLNVNWDAQAFEAVQNYKQTQVGFSCSGMLQQLTSSGFTHAQAVYGAKKDDVC